MSYLIKERMLRDKSDKADSVTECNSLVAIEETISAKKGKGNRDIDLFEAKQDEMEVADYHHFPAENLREIWLNIFDKLNAETKITFSKTCREWHDWMTSSRTCFLFREFVPMLVLTENRHKTLLNCRTICKSWTSDFDCVYPTRPPYLPLHTENHGDLENQVTLDNHFNSSEQIQRFLEEMHSHPGNPFPGRNIHLVCELPNEARRGTTAERLHLIREYFGKAIALLQLFGSHVHMALLCVGRNDRGHELDEMEAYNYIRSCLLHLPNLKSLWIVGHNNLSLSEEDLAFQREYPLPRLPHLEMVSLENTSHAIWNGVLESSCIPLNVKRLFLAPGPNVMEHLRIPEVAYFPNLEAFEVLLSIAYLERFVTVLEGAPIPQVRYACFVCLQDGQDIRRIFRILEVLAGSLTCLKLYAAFSEDSLRDAIATGFVINLPKLESLELINYNGPLDPFCQIQSLKRLKIEWSQVQQWDRSSVDFYGFEERMDESNVWERIPSLQKLQIRKVWSTGKGKTYHRSMLQLSPTE